MALSTMTARSAGDSITAADWDIVRNNILLIQELQQVSKKVMDKVLVFIIPSAATIVYPTPNDIINAAQDLATYVGASVVIGDVTVVIPFKKTI